MPTTYTIQLDEGNTDLKILDSAGYNFGLAKAVESGGTTTTNTIFLSSTDTVDKKVTNQNTLTWTENYALNYTFTVPGGGAAVTGQGNWQAVNLGDYYTINEFGAWVAGTGPSSNVLNVVNNYQEVNIIVAIQTGTDSQGNPIYNPIYVDPSALLFNATGSYLPLETIQLWWGQNQVTSTIIENQETPIETYTLSGTKEVYFWYNALKGEWKSQTSGPFSPS